LGKKLRAPFLEDTQRRYALCRAPFAPIQSAKPNFVENGRRP